MCVTFSTAGTGSSAAVTISGVSASCTSRTLHPTPCGNGAALLWEKLPWRFFVRPAITRRSGPLGVKKQEEKYTSSLRFEILCELGVWQNRDKQKTEENTDGKISQTNISGGFSGALHPINKTLKLEKTQQKVPGIKPLLKPSYHVVKDISNHI